jgi:sialidase-1
MVQTQSALLIAVGLALVAVTSVLGAPLAGKRPLTPRGGKLGAGVSEILRLAVCGGFVLLLTPGHVVAVSPAHLAKLTPACHGAQGTDAAQDNPYGFELGPVCEVRGRSDGDYPWRVEQLTCENAGTGLLRAYACLFTIPNYWAYGLFTSTSRCELPGKLFRARASGKPADQHHFLTPAFWHAANRYRMEDGRLYVAWRVRPPSKHVTGGRFSCVRPSRGPWEVWCNRGEDGKTVWTVELMRGGKRVAETVAVSPDGDPWFDVQLVAESRCLTLQINQKQRGRFTHDPYREPFYLQFGSRQPVSGGAEVVTEYREVFVHSIPYPYKGAKYAEGPEDVRPEDDAIVGYLHYATPQCPRASEGDIIVTKDGDLLAVYSHYYAGEGHDGSPARLVGRISKDGGGTWCEPWTVADRDEGSQGNVMSVSLLRAQNGDLLMAYYDRTPDMPAKGMVLRRSSNEGKTWSKRIVVTPTSGPNRHSANNACLTRLSDGRIVLATREYVGGIRWPYACYSDDDGRTWEAGSHVPDPGLTPFQRRHQNVNEPSICELADGRLLMTMRSIAGGQFFAWSKDRGQTWSKPVLSPLRGTCSPAVLRRIPNSKDILAIWTYGYGGRTPLVSAVSSDGGLTWQHLKLVEQSQYHRYCYVSCTFVKGRAVLSYMHAPGYSSIFRFEVQPGYIDSRFVSLPIKWFYRDP